MLKTPIAVFTYNRPDHTDLLLNSLSRCDRLGECDLHIYCDGPKYSENIPMVQSSRDIVDKWADKLSAITVKRDINYGLARSISTGVTELCDLYGRVIVVEDDFLLAPEFLDYMLSALDKYKYEDSVYQISGFLHNIDYETGKHPFFLPLTTTWGWATWKRAWNSFDANATGSLDKLADNNLRRQFNLDDAYPYFDMLQNRLAGKNDSWGILWWWSVFNAQGLVLYPPKSLVWVGGFDNSGTHCGSSTLNQYSADSFLNRKLAQPIILPSEIKAELNIFNSIKQWLKSQSGIYEQPSKLKIFHKLNKLFRKRKNQIIS